MDVPELVAVAVLVAVAEPVLVRELVEVPVLEDVLVRELVDVPELVAVPVLVAVAVVDTVGVGLGQFCASAMLSSPTGPSSADPSRMDMAMQAISGSHTPMPVFTPPVAVVARAAGMAEYGRTDHSRWGRVASGPIKVALPSR